MFASLPKAFWLWFDHFSPTFKNFQMCKYLRERYIPKGGRDGGERWGRPCRQERGCWSNIKELQMGKTKREGPSMRQEERQVGGSHLCGLHRTYPAQGPPSRPCLKSNTEKGRIMAIQARTHFSNNALGSQYLRRKEMTKNFLLSESQEISFMNSM